MPYATALTLFDPYIVYGQREFMETCWLPALDSGSIDAFIRAMETSVSPGCAIVTHEFKGAASRVSADATAFGLRRDHVLVEILATFGDGPDGLAEQRHRQWARATRELFNATALPGGYPNLLTADDPGRVARSYGPNAGAAHQSQAALRSRQRLPLRHSAAGHSRQDRRAWLAKRRGRMTPRRRRLAVIELPL